MLLIRLEPSQQGNSRRLIRAGLRDYIPIRFGMRLGRRSGPMLTHGKVWNAIDALARRYGLSPSGLYMYKVPLSSLSRSPGNG